MRGDQVGDVHGHRQTVWMDQVDVDQRHQQVIPHEEELKDGERRNRRHAHRDGEAEERSHGARTIDRR